MKIMTGKTGTPHVTSQQFRQLVEGTVGQDSYILASGENLEPELQTNNLLKIRSGMMSHHGNLSVVELGTYDEVTIQNGTQGMQRIDLVVNRYTRNEETGIEDNEWIVIMGTPAASDPVAPAYTEGNLQDGDLVDDCPVFEVHLDGINVTEVVKLLEVLQTIPELIGKLKLTHTFSVSDEIDTGETWVDGKRIYRKVIKTTDAISPNESLALYWDTINCSEIWIDLQNSYIRSSDSGQVYPLCVQYEDYFVGAWANGAGVRLYSNSGWNEAWTKVITVRYTKV